MDVKPTSKFRRTRPPVDERQLDELLKGAETHSVTLPTSMAPPAGPSPVTPSVTPAPELSLAVPAAATPAVPQAPRREPTRATVQVLVRLTPDQNALLEDVLANSMTSEARSKNQLVVGILVEGLKRRREEQARR
jgi:hypothetical protein